MSERVYGHTKNGEPITDEMIERLADEAERGYEPGQLRARRRGPGRPPLGADAKSVHSIRLDPALQAETSRRAAAEGTTVSEVIRRALREYLEPHEGAR
jgi:CRISPR-associated endonuclease/helicase Cas3